jgi:hypothetical protein
VNDKGRYRQHHRSGSALHLSRGVAGKNSKSIIHRILKLLFASDVPLRCLHRSVAKQKLNLFKFASTTMAQPGASAANIVGGQMSADGSKVGDDSSSIVDVSSTEPDVRVEFNIGGSNVAGY